MFHLNTMTGSNLYIYLHFNFNTHTEKMRSFLTSLLLLASTSSVSANKKDWSVWIKKMGSQKGLFYIAWFIWMTKKQEWKRSLKNYKNIVSIFAASEAAYKKEANNWVGPGGRKAHKAAKMFWIDCSDKEAKKICKKYKQQPNPINVQYWREGLFYKVSCCVVCTLLKLVNRNFIAMRHPSNSNTLSNSPSPMGPGSKIQKPMPSTTYQVRKKWKNWSSKKSQHCWCSTRPGVRHANQSNQLLPKSPN